MYHIINERSKYAQKDNKTKHNKKKTNKQYT